MVRSRALRLSLVLLSIFALATIPVSAQQANETAVAIDQVFVRSAPSTNDSILGELFAGDEVTVHGEQENGFISIFFGDYIGWVHMDYLSFPGDESSEAPTESPDPTMPEPTAVPTEEPATVPTQEPAEEPVDEAAPVTGTGGIIWPVSGGNWEILQGYNGSSHQNNSDLWQYRDSLDLVRTDGDTAGAQIYSPVTGTIRWLDPSSGGISIDMGNGYAVALFHVTFDSSLTAGQTVTQGQPLGYISGPGGAGYASTPHVHIAVWQTSDGGNWSRTSVPFEGDLAISGYSLPNNGEGYQHTGLTFNP